MHNPFANRRDDEARRHDEDREKYARDPRQDEARSWSGASEGRQDAWRQNRRQDEPYGYQAREDWRSDYRQDRGGSSRQDWGRRREADTDTSWGYYDAQRSDYSQYGERPRYNRGGYESYSSNSRGNEGRYGRSSFQDQPSHAYAPGSQIWDQGDRRAGHEDFEPDYLHWRNQQMSRFDQDYADWRSEKRQKFSSDFDTWRQTRPKKDEAHLKGENPIVGDIADGGVGDVDHRKKS